MSTVEAPREQEQIIGTVTGVISKGNDKFQAVVTPDGTQYTKNLWTKDITTVQYLNGMIGQRIAFLCNVSHWTNQSGQPVRSLWIDQIGAPAPGSPAMAGPPMAQPAPPIPPPPVIPPPQSVIVQPTVQPMQAPVADSDREAKIHRQTASKVAAILLTHVPPEERTMNTLLVLADRLVAYYDHGLPNAETLDDLMNRAMPSGMDETPPHTDDDIPF